MPHIHTKARNSPVSLYTPLSALNLSIRLTKLSQSNYWASHFKAIRVSKGWGSKIPVRRKFKKNLKVSGHRSMNKGSFAIEIGELGLKILARTFGVDVRVLLQV